MIKIVISNKYVFFKTIMSLLKKLILREIKTIMIVKLKEITQRTVKLYLDA